MCQLVCVCVFWQWKDESAYRLHMKARALPCPSPKLFAEVLCKAQQRKRVDKRKTSGSGLDQGILCTVMFCVVIWKETEETF